ncbi:hypothetical protein B0H14DRAFT_2563946 [Mycena olivaceomarginata]|nr:hypothetical protein B0H14DRAFT_2563946 [Mycena olivaceomarginata]
MSSCGWGRINGAGFTFENYTFLVLGGVNTLVTPTSLPSGGASYYAARSLLNTTPALHDCPSRPERPVRFINTTLGFAVASTWSDLQTRTLALRWQKAHYCLFGNHWRGATNRARYFDGGLSNNDLLCIDCVPCVARMLVDWVGFAHRASFAPARDASYVPNDNVICPVSFSCRVSPNFLQTASAHFFQHHVDKNHELRMGESAVFWVSRGPSGLPSSGISSLGSFSGIPSLYDLEISVSTDQASSLTFSIPTERYGYPFRLSDV